MGDSKEKIESFRRSVKKMTRNTAIFHMLKEELTILGYWKNKKRGNPRAGGIAKYRNKDKE